MYFYSYSNGSVLFCNLISVTCYTEKEKLFQSISGPVTGGEKHIRSTDENISSVVEIGNSVGILCIRTFLFLFD